MLLPFLTLLFLSVSNGAKFSGSVVGSTSGAAEDHWHFLAKFCFSNQFQNSAGIAKGLVVYNITTPSKDLELLLYLDTELEGSWDKAYSAFKEGRKTCKELVEMARKNGTSLVVSGHERTLYTEIHVHSYYWFLVAADCKSPLHFDYQLHFINSFPDSSQQKWYKEFSFDQQGLGQAYIFFFVLFLVVIGLHIYGVVTLVKTDEYHPLVKLVTIIVSLFLASNFFYMIHYSVFAGNGLGSPGAEGLGLICSMMAQLMFIFFCILISKGWAITSNQLQQALILKIVLGVMCILYFALFIWVFVGRDPASTIYFWDSGIGYCIVIVRIGLMAWFLWSLFATYTLEEDSSKRSFYTVFGGLAAVWFLIPPLLILIALGVDVWYRYRVITGITLLLDASAYIAGTVLFWPSRIRKYFSVNPVPLQSTLISGSHENAQHTYESL